MTNRERWLRALTFQTVDRVPLTPGGPRESTRRRWESEGFPKGAELREVLSEKLGIDLPAWQLDIGRIDRMIPQFEEEILRHENGHYLVRDWMGAIVEISDEFDLTYLRTARDFVTRRWVKCPVETREDFLAMKERYNPNVPSRYAMLNERLPALQGGEVSVFASINGPFWQLREWLGFEGLCYAMADDPDWVSEMCDFWQEYTLALLQNAAQKVRIDHIMVNEDMAYKAHAMISPQMTRDFVLPCYRAWSAQFYAQGGSVFEVDSDGYIGTLLPLWLESGVNSNSPVEVAAHNDIVAYRAQYGKKMAFRGGIDKRKLAAGGSEMRAELLRVVPPLLREGGYIPSCDHGVPPDISWPNFLAYAELLAQLCGWK